MLPLVLLRAAANQPLLIELKNGETYNGQLVNCDSWMNINLRDVICTSRDGDRFWQIPQCYIRGNTIKYLCVPEEVLEAVQNDESQVNRSDRSHPGRGRGERGRGRGDSRGRGRGDSRGGRGRGENRGKSEGGESKGRGRSESGEKGRGRGEKGRGRSEGRGRGR